MNSSTFREIEEFVLQLLGVLFQVGGTFLVIGGVFFLAIEVGFGQPFEINSLGIVFLTSGIALLLLGGLIFNENKRADEADYPLIETPVPRTNSSIEKSALSSSSSETHSCPSCGYRNPGGLFFCQSCNSELWRSGKSHNTPLPTGLVERRMKRVAAIRRMRRMIVPIVIVASIVVAVASNLFVGYEMVNGTAFRILNAYFQSGTTSGYGDLLITSGLEFTGQTPLDNPHIFQLGTSSYAAVLKTIAVPIFPCTITRVYVTADAYISCNLTIRNVSLTTLLGSHMEVTFAGIIHYYLYYRTVTLSDSVVLASTCSSPIQICEVY